MSGNSNDKINATGSAGLAAHGTARPRPRWWATLAQLPRDKADTLLLLLACVLVLAPHASHLPLWTSVTVALTLLWRGAITLRGKRLPALVLLLPLSLAAMAGVYASFHTLLGRDAGVAMLALLLAFKLLEMHAKRDLFVVIFLSFFLLLTNFFYSQSMATALLMLATVVLLLTAQLSFQYTGAVPPLARRLRLAGAIVAISAPLALLLFVAFPRIQGPLWGMPGDANGGRTGMSDSMAPGSLAGLAESNELAFNVRFIDPAPAQNTLYWRGVVLADYDGRTWTRVGAAAASAPRGNGRRPAPAPAVEIELTGKPLRYQVTMEANNQHWLYALELPERIQNQGDMRLGATPEMEFVTGLPIAARLRYDVTSVQTFIFQPQLEASHLQQWLALPAGYNPRTLALAHTLRRDGDPVASVNAVLHHFRNAPFRYTMTPPLLGRDAVDEFLFDSRAGFCEHYAGAFVVLMRAMQIPARVVTGYQGGTINPVDGYLAVRQSDAHAWAEVWVAGRGWLRVDPTAAVAPERVEKNLAAALPKPPPFGLESLTGFNLGDGGDGWWPGLRNQFGAINNGWNQWVLDYTPERQRGVMERLSALLVSWSALSALLLVGLLLWSWRRLRAQRRRDPLADLYAAFCLQQARRGVVRQPDEGPQDLARRLAALPLEPGKRTAVARFLAIYAAIKYGSGSPAANLAALKTLKSLLNECR